MPGEPLWLDDDREWAVALIQDERDACPGCGEPLHISTARESDGEYHADAIRCHGCAAQSRAVHSVDDKAGLLVTFTRRPRPQE